MFNCFVIKIDQVFVVIGLYFQVIKVGFIVYFFGQILLDLVIMELVGGGMDVQVWCVFDNFSVVCDVVGGVLYDIVKLNIFFIDLSYFNWVNEIMKEYFQEFYLVCVVIGVVVLFKGVEVEMDVVMDIV